MQQSSQKGKRNDAPTAALTSQAPLAFDRMDMCAIKVFNQSINHIVKKKNCQNNCQIQTPLR
jgi:hypothetical protein